MPLNQRKIAHVILEECENVEERCKGYRTEIAQLVVEILALEREHKLRHTNIQQKIGDQFDRVASILAEARDQQSPGANQCA